MLRESKENSNTSKQLYIDMGLRLRHGENEDELYTGTGS